MCFCSGWLFDISHGYLLPYILLATLQMCGAVAVFSIRFMKPAHSHNATHSNTGNNNPEIGPIQGWRHSVAHRWKTFLSKKKVEISHEVLKVIVIFKCFRNRRAAKSCTAFMQICGGNLRLKSLVIDGDLTVHSLTSCLLNSLPFQRVK